MIQYDRTGWWSVCFAIRGTVLPHILSRVGLLTALSLAVFAANENLLRPHNIHLQEFDPLGHSVMGVALSMLIVFRTNSSNSRFWEARTLWGGLINTSRNLVRVAAAYGGPADDLARLVSAYVVLVREQLRDHTGIDAVRNLLPGRVLECLQKANNPAQVLAASMSEWVTTRQAEGRFDSIVAMRLETLICTLVDNQGGCERIHRTPLPFVYAALIKQVLILYLATLPFVLVPKMGFLAPLVVAGVSLGMLGIEEAGVEIEDPFGLDLNHLPLEALCATIARDVHDLTSQRPA